jgi:hypothetical protein
MEDVMSRIRKKRLMIASLAAGFALAACTRAEPARETAASETSSSETKAPPAAEAPPAAGAPRLASSHGPLPGVVAPEGASPGGPPPAAAPPAGASPHGELKWDAPPSWVQESPSNPMRAAQYRVPATAGDTEDGECVVFYFGPGQGGDAASNASRWIAMFTTADGGPVGGRVTEQQVHGRKVTRVEASGTYHAMAFGGQSAPPRPGSMMLGAIVPGGDANWFFRCTGPQKTVAASRSAFDALVSSIH